MKRVLIIGLGVSGKSAANVLSNLKMEIFAYDDFINSSDEIPKDLKVDNIKYLFTKEEVLKNKYDLVMKSPGIKPTNSLIVELKSRGDKIVSDLEIGYLFKNEENIVAITGTNGKTTTTVLVNEILNASGISSDAVGNIGVGAVSELINTNKDYLVIECSSFQLEDIDKFKPNISIITNITSDHLDYHGDLDTYIKAKLNILKNLEEDDYAILNYDDEILRELKGNYKKIFISGKEKLDNGIYYLDDKIYLAKNGEHKEILDCKKIKIKGLHNYYNIMCALGVWEILSLDTEKVKDTIYNFQGVKHRLQFVIEKNGISYYNDSKGTNPDSTMKAISSFENPIVIILGGYDKKEDFKELLEFGKEKIKAILTFGETKEKIYNTAIDLGYDKVYKFENLKEIIEFSKNICEEKDVLLFSPACASWDMYKNFEERGNEFIDLVSNLE